MKNTVKLFGCSLLLTAGFQVSAATEIPETSYGFEDEPDGAEMLMDAVIARPLNAAMAVGGAATWLVSLPFTLWSGTNDAVAHKLITEPAMKLKRCLGCSELQDERFRQERYFRDLQLKQQGYYQSGTGYEKQTDYGYQYDNQNTQNP